LTGDGDRIKALNELTTSGFLIPRIADNSPAIRFGLKDDTIKVKIGIVIALLFIDLLNKKLTQILHYLV